MSKARLLNQLEQIYQSSNDTDDLHINALRLIDALVTYINDIQIKQAAEKIPF